MKKLSVALCICCTTVLLAQTITPDKTWHLESGMPCMEGDGTGCSCLLGTSTVNVGSTKTFGGKEYYELLSNTAVVNYVREEGDTVFFYSERCDEELLMYDFGLEVGDTISFANPRITSNCTPTERYAVTEVDSIEYNQEKRKRLKLSRTSGYDYHVWVQGIGSMQGINTVPGLWAAGGVTMLKSVYQSDNLVFENETPKYCWVTEPTRTILSSSANRLSGATGFVGVRQGHIALNLRSGVYVADLLNLQGRLVRRAPFSASDGQTLTPIGVTGLSPGVYLLRVKQGSLSVISSRVIVK